jgi:hypothetical protein
MSNINNLNTVNPSSITTPLKTFKTLTFDTLTLRNFMSYGNATTTFDFSRYGTTQIKGQNLDDTEQGIGANGVGKALTLESLLKTPTGWIIMKDVKVGDILLAPDGSHTKVTGVYPQGVLPIYDFKCSDGRQVQCCGEHLWTVSSHRWRKDYKSNATKTLTTTQLKEFVDDANSRKRNKPWYSCTIPRVVHPNVSNCKMLVPPYLLGALLGDGGLTRTTINLTTQDETILNQCNELLSASFGSIFVPNCITESWDKLSYRLKHENGQPEYTLRQALIEYGIYGCTSHNKFIPDHLLDAMSEAQKIQLLQGMMDTDGTVGKTGNISYTTVSEKMADQVQYIVRSLGGSATKSIKYPFFTDSNGNKKAGSTAFNLSIHINDARRLFTLPRKLARITEARQYDNMGLLVKSIEVTGNALCQCITVDHPDKLFITNDFIVTHNSSLIDALVYGVYGQPLSDMPIDNIVNDINNKDCVVGVNFHVGRDKYEVIRYRKMKAGPEGNYVELFKNDDPTNIALASVAETNKMIVDIVGMPRELFIRLVVFDADETSFFKLAADKQRDIMENIFQITLLSDKADNVKEENKSDKQKLAIKQVEIDSLLGEISKHETMLVSAIARQQQWETLRDKDINLLNHDLKQLSEIDIEYERQLIETYTNAENDMVALKQQVSEIKQQQLSKKSEIDAISNNISKIQSSIASSSKDIQRITKLIDENKRQISILSQNKCHECNQSLPDAESRIAEKQQIIDTNTQSLVTIEQAIHDHDNDSQLLKEQLVIEQELHKQLTESINKLNSDISQHMLTITKPNYSSDSQLAVIDTKKQNVASKIDDLSKSTNPHLEVVDELENSTPPAVNYDEINLLKKMVDHQTFMIKLLTDKKSFVRKKLIQQRLPFLNERLTHYLKKLGLPYTVQFNSDLTPSIVRRGKSKDFGNLSHGQRARVNFALSFAFRDVLVRTSRLVNICLLDEVLDKALCGVGTNSAVTMINEKAKEDKISIFVITHKNELSNKFHNQITVTLENGFSSIS